MNDRIRTEIKQNVSSDGAPNQVSDQERCVTVIINPKSGTGDPEARKEAITAALAAHGYTCQYVATTPKQGARHFAEEAIKHGVDLLAVSGGDGTVVEAMSALIGTDVPLAVFPAGTGNLLSTNLDIPRDIEQAAHTALFGQRRRIDLGRLSFGSDETYFAIIAGVGYDAKMIGDADREAKNKIGYLAYVWSALKNLGYRGARATVQLDDQPHRIQRRAKSVMIANMGQLPGGLDLIPDARPDDGALEVALLKANRITDWLGLLVRAASHTSQDQNTLEYHRARRIHVELSRLQPLQYDGEELKEVRSFHAEIVPGAVQVLVPAAES